MFSGPVPESLPSSISSFAHRRRSRSSSRASFSFFQPGREAHDGWQGQHGQDNQSEQALSDSEDDYGYAESIVESEIGGNDGESIRRKPHLHHVIDDEDGAEDPLLQRRDSAKSDAAHPGFRRTSQKIYIETEDLTIVLAGFTTSQLASLLLTILSFVTLGISWLILRWVPSWKIRLIGKPASLQHCEWVVVEVCNMVKLLSGSLLIYCVRINGAN